jgi:hypothetical protein
MKLIKLLKKSILLEKMKKIYQISLRAKINTNIIYNL